MIAITLLIFLPLVFFRRSNSNACHDIGMMGDTLQSVDDLIKFLYFFLVPRIWWLFSRDCSNISGDASHSIDKEGAFCVSAMLSEEGHRK